MILGLRGMPAAAEEVDAVRDCVLAKLTKAKVHIAHISTRGALEAVRRAKNEGLQVTCEVTPHHWTLTDEAVAEYDTNTKMSPPLRSREHVDAILEAMRDGTIDAVCSDHAPVEAEQKLLPFDEAAPGATALETLLPLVLKWASVNQVALLDALDKVSSAPGRILGEPTGRLAVGAKADICIFDPVEPWRPDAAALVSHGKNTPFSSFELLGRARYTLVGGEVRFARE